MYSTQPSRSVFGFFLVNRNFPKCIVTCLKVTFRPYSGSKAPNPLILHLALKTNYWHLKQLNENFRAQGELSNF